MKKKRRISGFTMAEMLIVVAIIAVLGGVSFIAVQTYQRSMQQLERDAIATEIFVAAQNHLTMAEGQGFLENSEFGVKYDDTSYYFLHNKGEAVGQDTLLGQMLPFGSVDETVRIGGSYIIHYQPRPAIMLDVFYCEESGGLSANPANVLGEKRGADKKASRRSNNPVLGWYGGNGATLPPPIDMISPK